MTTSKQKKYTINKKHTSLQYSLVALLLLISSCIDPFNLTLEDQGEYLVIDGSFAPNQASNTLQLYYANSRRRIGQRLIEDAAITLFENNERKATYINKKQGIYELSAEDSKGTIGNSYHIEVALSNGQIYQSEPEIVPELVKGDSVFFELSLQEEATPISVVRRPTLEVFIATSLPADKPIWLKWDIQNRYSFPEVSCGPFSVPAICYASVDIFKEEVLLLDGSNLSLDYLPKFKVAEKQLPSKDDEFRGRNYFLVNQQSITKAAYDYWRNINLVANQTGSIFDAPPAAVQGNLYNINDPTETVLGYFEVSSIDSLRGFVTAASIAKFHRFTFNACADLRANRACCRCEVIENSTMDRPNWW